MKNVKRFACLSLALLIAFGLLAGCSDGDVEETTTPTPTQQGETTAQPTETPTPEDEYVYRMPIVDDPVTITKWCLFESTVLESPTDIKSNIQFEKLTNVKVEYKLASVADSATNFNLIVTSGDFPDIMVGGEYNGGYDKAIEDYVYLNLVEVIDKWMPNVKSIIDEDDDIRKLFYTDSGNIGSIMQVSYGDPQYPFMGPAIRLDLLEKVGITGIPETYDELYNALTLFKNDVGVEMPLQISYSGYNAFLHTFTSGYDIAPAFYNENGTVKFGFIEDGFLEYLTMMHDWYAEGLIDPEFYTKAAEFTVNTGDMSGGKIGVAENAFYTMLDLFAMLSGDPDYRLVGMPLPKKNASDTLHFKMASSKASPGTSITTAVDTDDKLEIIARWLDYTFTEEGMLLNNYGIEGESYNLVDGKPILTDLILMNPDGKQPGDILGEFAGVLTNPGLYDHAREKQYVSENAWDATVIWNDSSLGDWVMPTITMTTDEGPEYSSIFNDINTYITETIPNFIIGTKPLEEFPDFVSMVKSMDIDTCIEIQQNALDRYLNR